MRKRRIILVSVASLTVVSLTAFLVWYWRCPIDYTVECEPSGMMSNGREATLVTFAIYNHDAVDVMFEKLNAFEVKVGSRWIQLDQKVEFSRIPARGRSRELLVVPANTEACRLHLNYQGETWKSRLIAVIGPTGRNWLMKSPRLCKYLWPTQGKTMASPPRWRTTTLEVILPPASNKTDQNTPPPLP